MPESLAVSNQPGPAPDGRELPEFLDGLRRLLGADSVQLAVFGPEARLLADCSPSSEIAENLLRTAGDLPAAAHGAKSLVNTYRFNGRLVHLLSADCQGGRWLLAWVRLPEDAVADHPLGILELAAKALPGPTQSEETNTEDPLREIDPDQARPDRLRQFCRWLERQTGAGEVILARQGVFYGWKLCAAARQLPSRNAPLAQAVRQAFNARSRSAALEEIQRLTEQPAAGTFPLGPRHAVMVAGPSAEMPAGLASEAGKLAALLDPPLTRLYLLRKNWKESSQLRRRVMVWLPLAIALILLFPVPQRVRTEVILEPAARRFVAAPFNAVVQTVHVLAGDVVNPGDLLVELDGREVSERLAEVQARLSMAILQNTSELESANYGEASIRALDAQGLTHERDLLVHRQENLKLHSPIHGVVVTGELERSEGAAVELGKPLLELAPLEALIAEMAVDEGDIALVRDGMTVRLQLNAVPGRRLKASVLKVSLRSETRDGRNVFVAEAELPNENGMLRPGMKGRAVILADRRPLIWTLLRKPWQMLQRWMFR